MSRAQIISLWLWFFVAAGAFSYLQYRQLPVDLPVIPDLQPVASAGPPAGSASPPQSPVVQAPGEQPAGTTEPTVTAADMRPELANIAVEALNASDPDDRGTAIQHLAAIQTPEVMYALGQALTDSALPNRHRSIESLRLIAANEGDRDGAIRQMLRLAMDDRDTEVSNHARTAYEEITELASAED
ncbi:MAG TPA: HEAT repeat domain-containing protein [Steroidobacteraceae bacterium]|nr:HEAT repeat domain-containing protein [Steroidobacteraceae bacterium]